MGTGRGKSHDPALESTLFFSFPQSLQHTHPSNVIKLLCSVLQQSTVYAVPHANMYEIIQLHDCIFGGK